MAELPPPPQLAYMYKFYVSLFGYRRSSIVVSLAGDPGIRLLLPILIVINKFSGAMFQVVLVGLSVTLMLF